MLSLCLFQKLNSSMFSENRDISYAWFNEKTHTVSVLDGGYKRLYSLKY